MDNERPDPVLEEIRRKKTRFLEGLHELDEIEREHLGSSYSPPEPVPTEGLFLTYADVMTARSGVGPRFSTGFSVIDKRLDGGLHAGNYCVIQGPPGSGKSLLATQLALQMAPTCAVTVLFADEGNASAAVTIAQQVGQARGAILKNEPDAVRNAVAALGALPFFRIVNHFHKLATLEQIVTELDAFGPPGLQRVLLVDSAQTARFGEIDGKESETEAVRRGVRLMFDQTRQRGLITIMVSRLNRAGFGKKKPDEEGVEPIAAAWGGGTEWDVDLMIHLDGNATQEEPKVRGRIVKNRISGWIGEVPMVLDWARKRLLERDPAVEEREKADKEALALSNVRDKILAVLTGRQGISGALLEKEVGGNRKRVREARVSLQTEGRVVSRKRGGKGGGEEWLLSGQNGGQPAVHVPAQEDLNFESEEEVEES